MLAEYLPGIDIKHSGSFLRTVSFVNPLRIQRTAGGTPSGERVKLSDTQKKSNTKKKVDHVVYPRKAEILVISTM